MATHLLAEWLDGPNIQPFSVGHVVYKAKSDRQAAAVTALGELLAGHSVGHETILKAGGFEKAADIIRNSLPTKKRIRSGDLAELLAAEFLAEKTTYKAPILKLRYKSDRDTALHGDDIIGVDDSGARPLVVKGEVKSRAKFYPSHVAEALGQLDANDGYPTPSTLAFITKRLYEQNRDLEAAVLRDLMCAGQLQPADIHHLLFIVCGNDCEATLKQVSRPLNAKISGRCSTAIVVEQHADFIASVFASCHGK